MPRTELQPFPGTVPLTLSTALVLRSRFAAASSLPKVIVEPLIHSSTHHRSFLAGISAILFFRLPLAYHVPFSIS